MIMPWQFISFPLTWSLLRLPAVLERIGDGRTKFFDDLAAGLWTQPVSIGARAVAWPDTEIAALIAARIAGYSANEIRALVIQLEAVRKDAPKYVANLYFPYLSIRNNEGESAGEVSPAGCLQMKEGQ